MKTSDHCDGRRFFNPTGPKQQPFSAVPCVVLERRTRWPSRVEVVPQVPPPLNDAAAVITFIGHSTLLIQTPIGNILTDPVYANVAGPFGIAGPRRVRAPGVRFEDLPPISLVLLSHNHYDHCDRRTLRRLAQRFQPGVITPLGNGPLLRATGMTRVTELDWWEQADHNGASITVTPAHHFSARTPFDRNRALWGGFVIALPGVRLYFAGDTAYSPLFADIRTRLSPIDVALLPIGAYEPRWFMQSVHTNPEEAVQAHLDLGAPRSIGIHFGTFQLTTEGIDAPLTALAAARDAHGVSPADFGTLEFGASLRVP